MSQILKVENLCKNFMINKKEVEILKNVNFSMQQGEFVAIMGPSGSGKSTLLYTVSGMDSITSGTVDFMSNRMESLKQNALAELRLNKMGFIFQQMYMLKNLSLYDNIVLPAYRAKKKKRKEINDYALELMKKTGIYEVRNNNINEVSGGQLQRACICRSMINNPNIIFADEPTGSLNKQMSNEVMDEILKMNNWGTSIMLVTHDVRVAAKADRVLYISDGNISGELLLGKYNNCEEELQSREIRLNNWLVEIGW